MSTITDTARVIAELRTPGERMDEVLALVKRHRDHLRSLAADRTDLVALNRSLVVDALYSDCLYAAGEDDSDDS